MTTSVNSSLAMCVFCCSVRHYDEYTYCKDCQDHGYTPIEEAMTYLGFSEEEKQEWRQS
jgi:hypothetical protein